MKKKQVIVVGAGCAGVYATHYLKSRGVDVHCFEASGHVGGRTWTYEKDGYLVETGALALEPAYKKVFELIEAAGVQDSYISPKSGMRVGFFRKNRWNLVGVGSAREQLKWLPETLRFRGIPLKAAKPGLKLYKAIQKDLANITPENRAKHSLDDLHYLADVSITEYCEQHGSREVDDYVVGPMMGMMMLGDSKDISIAHFIALFNNVSTGVEDSGGALFGIMRSGLSEFLEGVYKLDEECYSLSTPVTEIVIENGVAKGVMTPAGFVEADEVLCCTTAGVAKKIIPEAPEAMIELLDAIKYARTFSYSIGDRRKFLPDSLSMGFIPKPAKSLIRSVYSASKFNPHMTPDGKGDLVHVYTNYDYDEQLLAMSKEDRDKWVLAEAKKMFPLMPDRPELVESFRIEEAISMDAPGQMTAVYNYLENHLEDVKGLSLAGEYMYPMASTEGAMITSEQACERIMARIG